MDCTCPRLSDDVFCYFQEKEGELEHQKKLNELELQKAKELAEIEVWNKYSVIVVVIVSFQVILV